MTDPKSYAEVFAASASKALSRQALRTETFSVGPLAFRLIAPDRNPDRRLGRAFLPGSTHDADGALHCLSTWDGNDEESRPPDAQWDDAAMLPAGAFASHADGTVHCAVDVHTKSVIVSNFARGRSYCWYPDIDALPHWAKAAPFRIPLSWLCNRQGMQIVHGAAVAIGGRAALMVGKGGSGKSTTALACALAGFDYLGDDYCAVEPAARKVHMVYRTAKMFGGTLELLPTMRDQLENLHRLDVEKGVAFLEPDRFKLSRSANLSAILLPRIGEASSIVYPATREEVIRAVLPFTIVGLMGGTAATPRLLMELVSSVPAYHLVLRQDTAAVVDAVAACLAGE